MGAIRAKSASLWERIHKHEQIEMCNQPFVFLITESFSLRLLYLPIGSLSGTVVWSAAWCVQPVAGSS